MPPLKQFFCDYCGEIIATPSKGVLVWNKDDQCRHFGFRILHAKVAKPGCDCERTTSFMHLNDMLGHTGLVRLISFIHPGEDFTDKTAPYFVDAVEFAELMRRLTVPHYEEARRYMKQALKDGFIDSDTNEVHRFSEKTLKSIIHEYAEPS